MKWAAQTRSMKESVRRCVDQCFQAGTRLSMRTKGLGSRSWWLHFGRPREGRARGKGCSCRHEIACVVATRRYDARSERGEQRGLATVAERAERLR